MLMGLGGEVWGERATGKKKRVQYTHIKMASNSQGRVPGTKQADPSLGPDTQMAFWNPGWCPAGRRSRGCGEGRGLGGGGGGRGGERSEEHTSELQSQL